LREFDPNDLSFSNIHPLPLILTLLNSVYPSSLNFIYNKQGPPFLLPNFVILIFLNIAYFKLPIDLIRGISPFVIVPSANTISSSSKLYPYSIVINGLDNNG
jgi:hypothetical protein